MASEQDKQIGLQVLILRGDKTQQAVADGMRARGWKWSQATVWSIEKGERPLRLAEAADLSTVLGNSDMNLLTARPLDAEVGKASQSMDNAYQAIYEGVVNYLEAEESLRKILNGALEAGSQLTPDESFMLENLKTLTEAPEEAVQRGRKRFLALRDFRVRAAERQRQIDAGEIT